MDEYIKKDDVMNLLSKNSITKKITFADGVSIYDSVKNIPTVDVAPRAEVEYWKEQCFHACMNNGCLDKAIVDAAVAREIFEEIDKRLDHITVVVNPNDCFITTFRKTMEKVTAEVDDLKKKYTEGGK